MSKIIVYCNNLTPENASFPGRGAQHPAQITPIIASKNTVPPPVAIVALSSTRLRAYPNNIAGWLILLMTALPMNPYGLFNPEPTATGFEVLPRRWLGV
ncbi:MAG: hypothetical protein IT425_13865 [Pirellulales bacterium]|nr:hypothetical protein [Pirellulales bacterium]